MNHEDPHREAVVAVVFAAAWADGAIGDEEKQALDRILVRLGFSRADVMARIAGALAGPRTEVIDVPVDEALSVEIMRYALAVTLADGMLSQEEVHFLVKLAAHLGVSSTILSALGQEADKLLRPRAGDGPRSPGERVEALLPEARLALPELDITHAPAARQEISEEAASRTALSRLLYQGDHFGGELEL